MIKILSPLLIFTFSAMAFAASSTPRAPAESSPQLTVRITGLEDDRGKVIVALFDTEKDWLKKPLANLTVTPKNRTAVATFTGLKPGTYAASVIADQNNNGELDTNFLGMPTERYGFSNNATGTFGPASFADASFDYTGAQQEIAIEVE
ncbi:MAG: DUF2141 domain-containing protein [Verrucomicrobiota bacterium]